MNYWLFKTEPGAWSWDDQVKEGAAEWDGVRNFQASAQMKAMQIDDKGFFYHSQSDKAIVGVVRVVKEYYPDHTDATGRFGMVDVEPVEPFKRPVTLAEIKADPQFAEMKLVRAPRLSVQPVDAAAWKAICKMGGVDT